MATIGFAIAAQSFSIGPVAQILIGTALTFADQRFIMPGIFGDGIRDIQGARVDDLSVQGAAEGTPCKFALGSAVKLAGQIIWSTDLVETPFTTSAGGSKGGGGQTVQNVAYSISMAIKIVDTRDLTAGAIDEVLEVYANGKKIWDFSAGSTYEERADSRYESITFYKGNQTDVDPTIEASLGSSTPAFKDSAYMVLKGLQLASFGNSPPNFEILVRVNPAETYASAITQLCARAGLSPSEYDVSGVSTDAMLGIQMDGNQEPARGIENIMLVADVVPYESDGAIVFVDRSEQEPIEVSIDDFAAFDISDDEDVPSIPFWEEDVYDTKLPTSVSVTFDDPDCNYDRGARIASKLNAGGFERQRIDLPMTLTSDDGSLIAQKALWTQWGVRRSIRGTLMPSHIDKDPGDLLTVTRENGDVELIRIERLARGLNWLNRIEGRIEEPEIFEQTAITEDRNSKLSDDPFAGGGTISTMIVTDHYIYPYDINGPDTDLIYLAWKDSAGVQPTFARATLFASESSGGSYSQEYPNRSPSIDPNMTWQCRMGELLDAIPAAGRENGGFYWDRTTSFRIETSTDDWVPITETEENVFDGSNVIVVQDENGSPEILAFRDVQSLGSNVYRVSHLLRGLRGTFRNAEVGHSIGSLCTPLAEFIPNAGTAGKRELAMSEGLTSELDEHHWKLIATGISLSEASLVRQDMTGGTERPYPMYGGYAVRDDSGNLYILFNRTTRNRGGGMLAVPHTPPRHPRDALAFDLDILNPAGTEVLRTKSYSGVPGLGDAVPGNYFAPDIDGTVGPMVNSGYVVFQYPIDQQIEDGYAMDDREIKCVAYQKRTALGLAATDGRGWPSIRQSVKVK